MSLIVAVKVTVAVLVVGLAWRSWSAPCSFLCVFLVTIKDLVAFATVKFGFTLLRWL